MYHFFIKFALERVSYFFCCIPCFKLDRVTWAGKPGIFSMSHSSTLDSSNSKLLVVCHVSPFFGRKIMSLIYYSSQLELALFEIFLT
jgi:hypothetical protein